MPSSRDADASWHEEWVVQRFHATIQLDSSTKQIGGGSLVIEVRNPAAEACHYLEYYAVTFEGIPRKGASIDPWGDISFVGTRRAQQQGGSEFRDDSYPVTVIVALKDAGQLVMCGQEAHTGVNDLRQVRQN